MKNLSLLIALLFLSSCSIFMGREYYRHYIGYTDYDVQVIHPNEHGLDMNLQGKLFKISCAGGVYIDEDCNSYMSKFAYDKGYEYFTILDKNSKAYGKVITITYNPPKQPNSSNKYSYISEDLGSLVTYVPQVNSLNNYMYSKMYLIVLINADEIDQWNNYYRVSDYYLDGDGKDFTKKKTLTPEDNREKRERSIIEEEEELKKLTGKEFTERKIEIDRRKLEEANYKREIEVRRRRN